jgi:hypothetical protein
MRMHNCYSVLPLVLESECLAFSLVVKSGRESAKVELKFQLTFIPDGL